MQMIFEIPLILTFIGLSLILSFITFNGLFWGRFFHTKYKDDDKNLDRVVDQSTFALSSFFGLLALLLAFTFSMANDRHEIRKSNVILEANAIGTVYLRSDFLPEKSQPIFKELLEIYKDTRIELSHHPAGSESFKKLEAISVRVHKNMWDVTNVNADALNTPLGASFIASLNELIDAHTTRIAALKNRVSDVILYLMLIVSGTTMFWLGFSIGLRGNNNMLICILTVLLISSITNIILDLDRPTRGMIETNQTAIANSI